jgi:hypothetical protein
MWSQQVEIAGGKDDKSFLFPTSSLIIAETENANSHNFIFAKPYLIILIRPFTKIIVFHAYYEFNTS